MKRRVLALSLALVLLAGCAWVAKKPAETVPPTSAAPTAAPAATPSPEPAPTPTPEPKEKVRFGALKGPSGIGAVKLIADSEAGLTANDYDVTLAGENSQIVAGLSNGSLDLAAVASNVAANLYQKTSGGIQVAAVSGLGVLYILENGNSVRDLSDLEGKTLYAFGRGANPEFVLNYLLTENGVEPSEVDIQWKGAADEVVALMAAEQGWLCMLPVPAATGLMIKNPNVREALDLSAEWDELHNGSRLTMTTIVVRTQFAKEHPQAAAAFLEDYRASVDYVNGHVEEAAELTARYELAANAKVAKEAIPKCALVCITGTEEMQSALQGYYEVLWEADPQSVGGGLPDDGFYWREG